MTETDSLSKDKLLASLLQPKSCPSGKLIQVVSADGGDDAVVESPPAAIPVPQNDEGPTLMELMMEAQKAAQQSNIKEMEIKNAKDSKKIGGGFKKGFFGASSSNSSKPTKKADNNNNQVAAAAKPSPNNNNDIPTITKNTAALGLNGKSGGVKGSKIVEEVQQALKEDENPMLAKLKSGDWVTPDLVQVFQQNPVISRGLNNPKCQAAIQLMQRDPNEAKKKFGSDPEIDLFMREFGKVMAAHFEAMGNTSNKSAPSSSSSSSSSGSSNSAAYIKNEVSPSPIQEIGPLQAQALKRAKLV